MSGHSEITVTNESSVQPYAGWTEDHTVNCAQFLLSQLRIPAGSELSIAFIDPEPMTQLHEKWLDLAGPTDVMSFPMDELHEGCSEPGHLGDVVICPQVAQEQAQSAGHSTQQEIELLLTHGVLHLLGHDHAEPVEHEVMFTRQGQLLDAWLVARDAGAAATSNSDTPAPTEREAHSELPSNADVATSSSRRLS